MAVQYNATVKNTRMQAALTAIDAHANPATLEICNAAYAVTIVAIPLADPSFTLSGAVLTMATMPRSANATATNTAALARIKEGGGTVIIDGLTVGTSASDIILNSTSITSGQSVSITAVSTITHSA